MKRGPKSNPAETARKRKLWIEANKEKLKAQQKEWRKNNPNNVRADSKAHTDRRNGTLPFTPNPLPDRLLLTLHIRLTDTQRDYLDINKEMGRPQLYRAFRKQFNSNINKLQFNFALEKVWKTNGIAA